MDPREQPLVLSILTQVEGMFIAQVSPILQVSHVRGGQYKYSGHTIIFPQKISTIVNYLPHHLEDLDILVVRRHGIEGTKYHCHFTKSYIMNSLIYKIQHD
jgi:hypothetical protein